MNIYYPPQFWKDKKILFGMTGGISAYKVAGFISHLVQVGAEVQVIMTEAAKKFIGEITINALTRKPVYSNLFDYGEKILHIHLMREYDYLVVAPATANIIGKMAGGIGDDLLSSCFLVDPKKVILVPAMNVDMWNNPIVQENIKKLIAIGVRVMDPSSGNLACGERGTGRLPEQEEFLEALYYFLGSNRSLEGKRVLITSGPTREYLDPIRYLTNSSSGLMGCSLAAAARARGASVMLIGGPMSVRIPSGVDYLPIISTQDLEKATLEQFDKADICIMNAAVADYRPSIPSPAKIKKQGKNELVLNLTQNPDILSELGRRKVSQLLVGFCAEDRDIVSEARRKLRQKDCDVMVANHILPGESGFEVNNNKAWVLDKNGVTLDFPLMDKMDLAETIIDHLVVLLSCLK
jgi:phosphopantothenoylcysteine decarboxylase/phosphopantothenate--cysteine ligase